MPQIYCYRGPHGSYHMIKMDVKSLHKIGPSLMKSFEVVKPSYNWQNAILVAIGGSNHFTVYYGDKYLDI